MQNAQEKCRLITKGPLNGARHIGLDRACAYSKDHAGRRIRKEGGRIKLRIQRTTLVNTQGNSKASVVKSTSESGVEQARESCRHCFCGGRPPAMRSRRLLLKAEARTGGTPQLCVASEGIATDWLQ